MSDTYQIPSFNVRDLYQRAFGYTGLPFPGAGVRFGPNLNPLGTLDSVLEQYRTRPPAPEQPPYGSFERDSVLGSSYFMPIKINGFQLWNEPLVSISGQKKIITTAISGSKRRGSVKEIITIEDYEVRIRGFIINDNDPDEYPQREVRQFRELYEINQAVSVDCLLLSLFNITQIVLKSFDMPEMEGYPGMQAYSISAISDEPFEFDLRNPLNRL